MITNRPDINASTIVRFATTLTPGAVYELENGSLVAVSFWQERTQANSLSCGIAAWQIDQDGEPVRVADEDGYVLVESRHNASAQQVEALGMQGIASAMLGLVLGQDPGSNPPIPWSGWHWQEMNIRTAITIANAMSETIELGALT